MLKFYVEAMPETEKECDFAKWTPFPPLLQKPGYYKCTKGDEPCSLHNGKCRHLCALDKE